MPADAVAREDDPSNERAIARTFHHSAFTPARLATARAEHGLSVSVCLPARECAGTVGEIVTALGALREEGVLDQIVVVDADSQDGTAVIASRAGAEVYQEAELMPAHGPVLGKGDAMWRALSVLEGELVCFIDADSERFSAHFATGLLGPLLCEPDLAFVKGYYRRPLGATVESAAEAEGRAGADQRPAAAASTAIAAPQGGAGAEGGGRVNHLLARPALALFYPQLAQIRQPLAGEVAARRELLERLPFVTGYGVEIAMLIDVWRAVGIERIAQVDLEEHHNRHQPLSALSPMALTVLATIARRLEQDGRLLPSEAVAGEGAAVGAAVLDAAADHVAALAPPERPPLVSLSVT
jgi:glucosyl-3-phosphoglycerate synthase